MATIAQSPADAERRFYSGMAIFMILLVLAGFAPSFYLRGLVFVPRHNPTLTPFVIMHGLAFTAWMLLFLAQTRLVAAGRRDLHMKLGVAGMAFSALLVPLMYATAVGQVARANQMPFTTPLAWTAVPLIPTIAFVILVALGWRYRREAQAHKRLMLCAALLMMDPAIGRLPIAPPTFVGFSILGFVSWLTVVPLLLWDRKTIGRLHWATQLGAGLFAGAMILRMVALASPAWERFAAGLPGV